MEPTGTGESVRIGLVEIRSDGRDGRGSIGIAVEMKTVVVSARRQHQAEVRLPKNA
jgi:hypothetical protein